MITDICGSTAADGICDGTATGGAKYVGAELPKAEFELELEDEFHADDELVPRADAEFDDAVDDD